MRPLNKIETILLLLGGALMVLCAAGIMFINLYTQAPLLNPWVRILPWIFLLGTILYVSMQCRQTYRGTSIALHRLRGIQVISGICLILSSLLMIENFRRIVQPYVVSDLNSYALYVQVVHNNWVVLMLIGALLQMYTSHRISSELRKES